MARLIALDRKAVYTAMKKHDERVAKEPLVAGELEELERRIAEEKQRRDAAHAALEEISPEGN